MTRKNLILVHGSFHTGECWYLLKPLLEDLGFTVRTPTLRGQRGNPYNPFLVTMRTYATDILRCADTLEGPSILLGHSLAGFAISVAAEQARGRFDKLIYLCAAIPKLGKSNLRDTMPSERNNEAKFRLRPAMQFPLEAAREILYNCCPPDVQSKAISQLSPQPLRPLLGSVRSTEMGLGAVRKHMIATAQDHVMPLKDQLTRQTNLNFETLQTLDCDHSPFLSRPEALAAAIVKISQHRPSDQEISSRP